MHNRCISVAEQANYASARFNTLEEVVFTICICVKIPDREPCQCQYASETSCLVLNPEGRPLAANGSDHTANAFLSRKTLF
jgi:hypothetical protein